MDSIWNVEMFGWLRATYGSLTVSRFESQKVALLFAYLAYHKHRSHPREELVELLWPEDDLTTTRHRLSQALSTLRRQLEPPGIESGAVIQADRYTIQFNPNLIQTDTQLFEESLKKADRCTTASQRTQSLSEALGIYRSEFLPGFYEPWIVTERQRFQDLSLYARQELLTISEEAGQFADSINHARKIISANPLDESAHCNLMRLFIRVEQPALAIEQYEMLREILHSEFSETPSERAKQLLEEASHMPKKQSLDHHINTKQTENQSNLENTSQSAHTKANVQSNLPVHVTKFFGRTEDIERIVEIMSSGDVRLLTLFGAGGCGKTRLSIEAAKQLSEKFQGGLWFIPLADTAHSSLLMDDILSTLQVQRRPGKSALDHTIEFLRVQESKGRVLLILDNFEHLSHDGGLLIKALLTTVPNLTCLITSRHRLHLDGEVEHPVKPLPIPSAPHSQMTPEALMAYPSIQLFMNRAQAVRAYFQITPRNASTITKVCEQLEGIPLALELAAPLVQTLSPKQILHELSQTFDLLVSRRKDSNSRHGSLRAAFEYSYRQLPDELKSLMGRLSVFKGGWTIEAATLISSRLQGKEIELTNLQSQTGTILMKETREGLTQLLERSLIVRDETIHGDEAIRYRMLEPLREYAAEELSEIELAELSRRHALYCLQFVEQAEPHLSGDEQAVWFSRLESELDNIRLALTWATQHGNTALGLRIASCINWFWQARCYSEEGARILSTLLSLKEASDLSPAILGKAYSALGCQEIRHNNNQGSEAAHRKALELSQQTNDLVSMGTSYTGLGIVAARNGDDTLAEAMFRESLQISRELNDAFGIARSLNSLATMKANHELWPEALDLMLESLEFLQVSRNQYALGITYKNVAVILSGLERHSEAMAYYEQAYQVFNEIGDRRGIACTMTHEGDSLFEMGEFDKASTLLCEALKILSDLEISIALADCLVSFSEMEFARHEYRHAAQVLGLADSVRDKIMLHVSDPLRHKRETLIHGLESALGPRVFSLELARGANSTVEDVTAAILERWYISPVA